MAGNVISSAQYDAALAELAQQDHDNEPFQTLGGGLIWLSEVDLFSDDDLAALERTSEQEAAFSTNATRKQSLEEFHAELQAYVQHAADAEYRELKKQFWNQLLPGPRWAWMVGGPCLLLAGLWYILTPDAAPACDDTNVKRTITFAMFEAQLKASPFNNPADPQPNMLGATLKDVSEVGYIKAERSRGCTATLKVDDLEMPVAYTIGPDKDGKSMVVAGGSSRIIRAKYGLTKDGKLPEAGQPIGATALRTAFTEAVALMEKTPAQASAFAAARRSRLKMLGRESEVDKPNVRSVIPLAACTATNPGQYTCRLQVQYSDMLMLTIGSGDLQLFEDDFEFEQQAGHWQVAPGFQRKFIDAQTRARIADLKGDDAALALEKIQQERNSKALPTDNDKN